MGYQATGTLQTAVQATAEVASDPHLPEVVCHVLRLSKMEKGQHPGPPCPKVSLTKDPGKGVGLRHAMVPIRVAVKVRERPVMAMAVVGVSLVSLFALGYAVGRRKRA